MAASKRVLGRTGCIVGMLLPLLAPTPLLADGGRLDPTFGHAGRVITNTGGGIGLALALQPDGKLVVVGVHAGGQGPEFRFGLVRYLPDGKLDPSFGSGGMVTTDMGRRNDWPRAVAIQPDGRIVVAGTVIDQHGSDGVFALARYDPDGTLERTFGTDGKVLHRFGSDHAGAEGVAIQADGKIVAVGRVHSAPLTDDFAVARYTSDGELDPTFDGDGMQVTRFDEGDSIARGVVIQPDGKIVVVGGPGLSFGLARYLSDGTLDPSFGGDGTVTTAFPGFATAYALGLRLDGRIVAVGGAEGAGGEVTFALAQYLPDGGLDQSFGADGTLLTVFPEGASQALSVAIQSDERIVAAGGANIEAGIRLTSDFGLARYMPDGSLDQTFGRDGLVTTSLGKGTDEAQAVVVQLDGRIVAAGGGGLSHDRVGFALARYEGE